ncbi:hypothetical protein Q7P36_005713 [Cladosporium allicinum]|jgi:hypothetical protein
MDTPTESPSDRVLATPELLELILVPLLSQLREPLEREDPRSTKTRMNASILLNILSLRRVNRDFNAILTTSIYLRRGLFFAPDHPPNRSWSCESAGHLPAILRSFYRCPALKSPPILNPIAQTTFPNYHFRYWHLDPAASGNKYCAYMIITRDDIRRYRAVTATQEKVLDRMLLSQPPALALEPMVWADRDETKEYLGQTTDLSDVRIENEAGVTVGELHRKLGELFDRYQDVPAIKLTTV